MKNKQLILITEAERNGIMYGQDVVTHISKSTAAARRGLQGSTGFVDGLIENLKNGMPVTLDKLERLRNVYFPMIDSELEFLGAASQALWREIQNEENRARIEDEIERGVNH